MDTDGFQWNLGAYGVLVLATTGPVSAREAPKARELEESAQLRYDGEVLVALTSCKELFPCWCSSDDGLQGLRLRK